MGATCTGFSWIKQGVRGYEASSSFYQITTARIFSDNPPTITFFVSVVEADEVFADDEVDGNEVVLAVVAN